MEIVPLTEGERTGAEAREGGTRVAHLVGALGEAPSRGRHAWVELGDHSLAPGAEPALLADVPREEMREGWEELLAEEGTVVLLAEREGETVGDVATYPGDEPGLAHLPVAGTRPEARGGGVGKALVEHALLRAHRDGFHTVALDWRSPNLLASRFWPRRGFVPTHLRLRRDVQPTA